MTTGLLATASAAQAADPTCAATVTSVALSGPTRVDRSGQVNENWENPSWTFTNNAQSGVSGNATFDITVASDAKPGDQFSLLASDIGMFRGTPSSLIDSATGEVIATAVHDSFRTVTFTFTDFVSTHTNVSATYTQSYGYSSSFAPGAVLQPGVDYTPTFAGCDGGASASFIVTTQDPFNSPGFRSSWSGSQNVARTANVYNGPQATTANDLHTITLGIDRPGTKLDCSQFNNTTSPYGVGHGIWDDKLMTSAPLSSQTTGTPGPGEYRVVSCSDREVVIEWMPAAVGESFRAQFLTVPDGTSGWEALGELPFTMTATETSSAGTVNRTNQPVRPMSDGSGGGVQQTDPVVTKSRNSDGDFVLTVSNPSADKVVLANTYTDALYNAARELDPNQLTISQPSLGTVNGNAWTLPALAPGESATALVEFDEKSQVEPGTSVLNRFGPSGSDCVTGAPDPSEPGSLCGEVVVERAPALGSVAWEKTNPDDGLLAGSEWQLTAASGDPILVVDNGANDVDPEAGRIQVADLAQGNYSLLETKAPTGYVLDETEHEFTIDATNLEIALGGIVNQPEQTMPLKPQPLPEDEKADAPKDKAGSLSPTAAAAATEAEALATTGGAGSLPLIGAGALAILAGAAIVVFRKRRLQK